MNGAFKFEPRWKEELLVTGEGGRFVLEMPMGVSSVYFPSESIWQDLSPDWAKSQYNDIETELSRWCSDHAIDLYVSASATLTILSEGKA